jgi:prepilin-type N-terminal cleavage/methylation domain-containing protein
MIRPLSFAAARTRRAPMPRLRSRAGFTLAELIVSVVIITVGVLSLAGSSVGVVRQMRSGNQSTLAATVAQSRLEKIRSRPCAGLSSGDSVTRGMSEKWVVSTPSASRMTAVAETVTYSPRNGVTKQLALVGWVPCI